MVEYLSGGRVQGSTAKSPPQTSWKVIASSSGTSNPNTTGTFTSTPENVMILTTAFEADSYLRFGAGGTIDDTGTNGVDGNYCQRMIEDFGTDTTNQILKNFLQVNGGGSLQSNEGIFNFITGVNVNGREKLFEVQSANNSYGTATDDQAGTYQRQMKWANTGVMNIARMYSPSGTYTSDSEIIVLGADNTEADTGTNFWELLEEKTLASANANFNTDDFAEKKYLWIQIHDTNTTVNRNEIQFNSISGANYNLIYERNGTKSVEDGQTKLKMGANTWTGEAFHNIFICNISTKCKLIVWQTAKGTNRTVGAATFTKTDQAIKSLQMTALAGSGGSSSIGAGSTIKVWGGQL